MTFNVQLGAAAIQQTLISRVDAESLQSKGISVSAAAQGSGWGFSASASATVDSQSSRASALSSLNKEISEYYIGSGRPQDGDMEEWATNIQESAYPVPTTFRLGYIGDLFVSTYFEGRYEAAEIEQMKKDFDDAMIEELQKYPSVPYYDIGLSKKVIQSQSICIGQPGNYVKNPLPVLYTNTSFSNENHYG